MTGETGSYRYMAPEVFRHAKYNEKVDQYSFAIVVWEMLEGTMYLPYLKAIDVAYSSEAGHRFFPPYVFLLAVRIHYLLVGFVFLQARFYEEVQTRDSGASGSLLGEQPRKEACV